MHNPTSLNALDPMNIYRLTPSDAIDYRTLMLEAYEAHPEVFTSNASEPAALPLRWWESKLDERADNRDTVFGSFEAERLVGVAGLSRETRDKVSHKATHFGMNVAPSFRCRGIEDGLVRAVLQYAHSHWHHRGSADGD